jgi:hypothetical protein
LIEEVDESVGSVRGRVMSAGDGSEMEIRAPAYCASDVAAADIERKHTALHKVSHHQHRKPHPTRAIPQAMRLLPFVPYRTAGRLESFRKNLGTPAENKRQFRADAAIMVAELRGGMLFAEGLIIAIFGNVIFASLDNLMR